MKSCVRISVQVSPNPSFPHTQENLSVVIVAGVGPYGRSVPYFGKLKARSVLAQLKTIRSLPVEPWAYLEINGKRIEDNEISDALKAVR